MEKIGQVVEIEKRGAMLKAMGVKSGAPDLVILIPPSTAAFIEIKSPSGRLSTAQIATAQILMGAGFQFETVRSLDDMTSRLKTWGVVK